MLAGQVCWPEWCSLHSANTAHLTCIYALRVMVNIPRRSEWRRSIALTAGPCVSLAWNRPISIEAERLSAETLEAAHAPVVAVLCYFMSLHRRQVTPEEIIAEIVVRPQINRVCEIASAQLGHHPRNPLAGSVGTLRVHRQRVRWPATGCLHAEVPDAPVARAVRRLCQVILLFGATNAGYE